MSSIKINDWHQPMWSKKELAYRWKCTTATIDNYVKEGIISPCAKIGRNNIFKIEDILSVEETDFNPLSPLERRRLLKKMDELELRLKKYEVAFSKIKIATSDCMIKELKEGALM